MTNKILHLLKEREFQLYIIIGLSGVAIDFLIYLFLVYIGINPLIASFASVSVAIVNNFLLNRHFNFKKKDHALQRFISFYTVGLTGVILSIFFIYILHTIFGTGAVLAKLISVPFIVIFQYWFNKNASFASNHKSLPVKEIMLFTICLGVVALFALNGPYHGFTDEDDNLLGAQFIANGDGVIYKDYFSHHMPLTYFIIAPLFVIFGVNLIAIKVAFGLAMSAWLLIMSRHLLKKYSLFIFGLFVSIIALSQMLSWSHMVLAETFISFALIHTLILFATRSQRNTYTDVFTLLILGSIPVLSALSYAPLSLLIYGIALFTAIEKITKAKQFPKKSFVIAVLIAIIPYIALLAYLYFTHSFGEMKEQALSFNTLFYSQFSASAATTPIDAVASIVQGSFQSYKDSLSFQGGSHPQPLSFLFTSAITLSVILFFTFKKYSLGIFFIAALILSSGRYGFASMFSNDGQARAGMILTIIGTLSIVLAVHFLRSKEHRKFQYKNACLIGLFTVLGFVVLSSVSLVSTTIRDYQLSKSLVTAPAQPGSASTVINIVNEPKDFYWVGPIDFASQIFIKSHNASDYRFYAPWHSVCQECTGELAKDISVKKPNVISLDTDMSIWGYKVEQYSEKLRSTYEMDYYQLPDPRLKHYWFLKKNQQTINQKLDRAGYDL